MAFWSLSVIVSSLSCSIYLIIFILWMIIIILAEAQQIAPASAPLMTTFDATWDAMKCAMKITLIQIAKYHNNLMSCCGLWIAKWFMKTSAEQYCERPEGAKQIFDQYINGDLIYNQMVRSVLGDDQMSCEKYPEGSPACTRLWILIIVLIIVLNIIIYFIIIWCCCVTCFWCGTRRENHRLKAKINGDIHDSESASTINLLVPLKDQGDKNQQHNQNNQKREHHSAKSQNGLISRNTIRPIQIYDSSSDKVPIPIDEDVGSSISRADGFDIGYNDEDNDNDFTGNLKV